MWSPASWWADKVLLLLLLLLLLSYCGQRHSVAPPPPVWSCYRWPHFLCYQYYTVCISLSLSHTHTHTQCDITLYMKQIFIQMHKRQPSWCLMYFHGDHRQWNTIGWAPMTSALPSKSRDVTWRLFQSRSPGPDEIFLDDPAVIILPCCVRRIMTYNMFQSPDFLFVFHGGHQVGLP